MKPNLNLTGLEEVPTLTHLAAQDKEAKRQAFEERRFNLFVAAAIQGICANHFIEFPKRKTIAKYAVEIARDTIDYINSGDVNEES